MSVAMRCGCVCVLLTCTGLPQVMAVDTPFRSELFSMWADSAHIDLRGGDGFVMGTSASRAFFAYEKLRIEAYRMAYRQAKIAPLNESIPILLTVMPALVGDKVLIDTTGTELPGFPVRMRVEPTSATIAYQPQLSRPGFMAWQLRLTGLTTIAMTIRGKDGNWLYHRIDCESIEAVFQADLSPKGLGSPRIQSLDLLGRPGARARLRRYRVPVDDPTAEDPINRLLDATAVRLTVQCDDQGQVLGLSGSGDFQASGQTEDARMPTTLPGSTGPAVSKP